MRLLAPLREHYHPKIQAPRQEGPPRKGPCPCGSGEKYKRCCGMTA
ncbi:SEC-C metal-binding domain-containing protein [Sorangium sp. So ce834]